MLILKHIYTNAPRALFIIVKNWKHSTDHSSTNEQIDRLRYTCKIEYYSATKRNKPIHASTWTNLRIIMFSERSKKVHTVLFHLYKIMVKVS